VNFPFFIAKRYLVSKKTHNATNIISGISIAGICIGTLALVIVLSAFNGLSELVQTLYNSFDAEIEITVKQGKTFNPNSPEFNALKHIEGISYISESVEGNALLKYEAQQSIATIKGVSKDFQKMTRVDTLVLDGNFNINKNNIVIGKGLSQVLQLRMNDLSSWISIYAPKRGKLKSLNPEEGLNEMNAYASGTFSINDEFDFSYVIMNIEDARQLLDYDKNEVSAIELGINPTADGEKIQKQLINVLGDNYYVKNRAQQNAELYKTMESEKLWTFIILIFILVIATFNVIGSLTILILEKKKDITILHHLGADIKAIRRIFLVEGLLITAIGALSGLLLGILLCWIQMKYELISMSEGLLINAYPVKVEALDIVAIMLAVFTIGFVAAWYPVRVFTKRHLSI
jgi:lipoprotein-releasing system permease protein